jgi:pimeloyl-ACP methyl ester carboxylesterase
MRLLDTPAATIAYDERGSGRAVVLLPSGAHTRHDFDALRALLPDTLRTIALDWPGHGDSPAPRVRMSAMAIADVAETCVAQLAPGGAIVIGNSVGGFAAARMAARRGELVDGLVVVDGGGFAPRSPLVLLTCALMGRPRFLRAVYPAFSSLYTRGRSDTERRARAASIATTRGDPGLRVVAELWRSFASPEHDLRAEAGAIRAPTLMVWGRRDPVIPLRVGRRAASIVPGARLAVLDTGHLPHVSEPERFAQELLGFVEAIPARTPAGTATARTRAPGH